MSVQDKSVFDVDRNIALINRLPWFGQSNQSTATITEFERELDLAQGDEFEFETDYDENQQQDSYLKLKSGEHAHLEFDNFLTLEKKFADRKDKLHSFNLDNKTIKLNNEHKDFNVSLYFADHKTVSQQIGYYKTVLNNIKNLKNKLKKVTNVLKKNDIHQKPTIVLADSYNDIFPYWTDDESHLVPACYYLDTVYLFVNYKLKSGLKLKETNDSILHELGHMIENRLYKEKAEFHTTPNGFKKRIKKNKYSSLIRQDFKLALKQKTSKTLNREPFASYYDHVAPPTTFKKLNHSTIMSTVSKSELFAESFSYYIDFHGKSFKRSRYNCKNPVLNEMFPNTHYIVGQTVKGKSVNKYKVLKQKKRSKMIKI